MPQGSIKVRGKMQRVAVINADKTIAKTTIGLDAASYEKLIHDEHVIHHCDNACKPAGEVQSTTSKVPEATEEMLNIEYNGTKVADIAQEYVASKGGVPPEGQRHAFYNEMVKNFRNLCDNDPRILLAVLPLCEGTKEKRWSQCTSICRRNETSILPKDFYFWLVKKGYAKRKADKEVEQFLADEKAEESYPAPPKLPPVFREFCEICPNDFVYPTVVALLPVMGTLTSYVKAMYMDGIEQTTTFFSTIYAPPSSNKSFCSRIVDLLMSKIRLRDEINSIRENLWLVDTRTKGDNKDKQDLPHVKVRIMPAINSLPEFLEKMRDNMGYHMFTFAEEVDTFAQGTKAAGGDKSDLFRSAWDNALYGQSFKSVNTFKGMVRVYYNILLTGTPGAVHKYYSNVEDGMVTRISICEIRNQKFAKFEPWKALSKKQMKTIDAFVERCDVNSYQNPLEATQDDAYTYQNNMNEYDKNIPWRFKMREKQEVDMSWMFKPLQAWLERQRVQASMDQNDALDVFRRRTAVKAFRLALLCTCCWENIREKEKKIIRDFAMWFADCDLKESLHFFGEEYNRLSHEGKRYVRVQASLYDTLPETFTKNDVVRECINLHIFSPVRTILYRWRRDRVIAKTEDKNTFVKMKIKPA